MKSHGMLLRPRTQEMLHAQHGAKNGKQELMRHGPPTLPICACVASSLPRRNGRMNLIVADVYDAVTPRLLFC